jgi:serine/threonine protein kinase
MSWLERYKELLQKQEVAHLCSNRMIMRRYGQITMPIGPIECEEEDFGKISTTKIEGLGGKLFWYAYKSDKPSEWYGVIKRNHYEIQQYKSSNIRNQIRKGLKNFEIRRVSVAEVIKLGYSCFFNSQKRFQKECNILEHLQWENQIASYVGFEDIVHFWGVFQNDVLKGYAIVYSYGTVEANISEIRMMPEANKQYASYALFHLLGEVYLHELNFNYISDGYRNLVHETSIQKLLIQKFGFEKVYLQLKVVIGFPYNIIFFFLYPFRQLFRNGNIKGVLNLNRFSQCK